MLKTFVSGIKMYLDKAVNQLRNEVGWKSETSEQLFSETATTVDEEAVSSATLSYAEQITADTLKITFNGTEYICTKRQVEGTTDVEYGGTYNVDTEEFDFSEYPFILSATVNGNTILTETPGTYTVSASADTVTYTDTFKDGVYKNVLKEVENENEADIVVLIPIFLETLPVVTRNCLRLSTSGNPTSYSENVYFGQSTTVLYLGDSGEFCNDRYNYINNMLTKTARCYYGYASGNPEDLAFRIESDATLENVSDYYEIKYYAYGLSNALYGGSNGALT